MSEKSFCAFISYSRKDSQIARWVQKSLESYRYPKSLVSFESRPLDPDRIRPVFMDASDLPTSSKSFRQEIQNKLNQSDFLIVICSRASAASSYVNWEISEFLAPSEDRINKIILVIVDSQVQLSAPGAEDFPQEIFKRWTWFSFRNHPRLLQSNEESWNLTRQRAMMQIASFILDVDWTLLHNRYLIERRRMLIYLFASGLAILGAVAGLLSWALWKQRELTVFERKIFPYSIVVGYVDNFLSPLITALESREVKPRIMIVLPATYAQLDHNKRVEYYRARAAAAGYQAELVKIATSLPRGAETAIIKPVPPYYAERKMELYIDFASTVTAFRHVIDYKKENHFYSASTENSMLHEYADEFESAVMERLKLNQSRGDQRERVVFVRSPEDALKVLNGEL